MKIRYKNKRDQFKAERDKFKHMLDLANKKLRKIKKEKFEVKRYESVSTLIACERTKVYCENCGEFHEVVKI
jgi:hypothetical protein